MAQSLFLHEKEKLKKYRRGLQNLKEVEVKIQENAKSLLAYQSR